MIHVSRGRSDARLLRCRRRHLIGRRLHGVAVRLYLPIAGKRCRERRRPEAPDHERDLAFHDWQRLSRGIEDAAKLPPAIGDRDLWREAANPGEEHRMARSAVLAPREERRAILNDDDRAALDRPVAMNDVAVLRPQLAEPFGV